MNKHSIRQAPTAFAWFFCVLAAYYLIRPVRETMGSRLGTAAVQQLFAIVFVTMLVANPIYSWLVARVSRRVLIHIAYRFFAACLLAFWLAFRSYETPPDWLAQTLFVWVSVFNLFAVSMFWSFMADSFTREQARGWYGMIAAGGTLGAVCGSYLGGLLIASWGLANMFLLPAVLLELATHLMDRTHRIAVRLASDADPGEVATSADQAEQPTGGNFWEGLASIVRSPYLLMICLALVITQWCGTTAYMQQTELVGNELATDEERFLFYARLNQYGQMLTALFQAFVAGLLMKYAGLAITLCILPVVYFSSFAWLASDASLIVLAISLVLQRSVALGLTEPAKQTLFTVVPREQKYKSKAFIDTVVFRGGDVVASWAFVTLQQQVTLSTINYIMLPVIAVWLGIVWWLGRRSQTLRPLK